MARLARLTAILANGGAMGRPSSYTPELAAEICERLSTGEPLAQICRSEHMPAVRTVSDWKAIHSGFAADFAHAREEGFDAIAADCLAIADDGSRDYSLDVEGFHVDHDHIQRSKLRIETRLKLLAKWDHKRYGDKVALEHSGTVRSTNELTDDELANIAAGRSAGVADTPAGPFIVRDVL